jgi:hypothetical protein
MLLNATRFFANEIQMAKLALSVKVCSDRSKDRRSMVEMGSYGRVASIPNAPESSVLGLAWFRNIWRVQPEEETLKCD